MRYLRFSALLFAAICSLFILAAGTAQPEFYLGSHLFESATPVSSSVDENRIFALVRDRDVLVSTIRPRVEPFTNIRRMSVSVKIERFVNAEGEDCTEQGIIIRLHMINANHHFVTSEGEGSTTPIAVTFYITDEPIIKTNLKYNLKMNERYSTITYDLQSEKLEMIDKDRFSRINRVVVNFPAHEITVYPRAQ